MIINHKGFTILTNPSNKIVSNIFKNGIAKKSKTITTKVLGNIILDNADLALIISVPKKVYKLAVDRNYIKRYIRNEFLKLNLEEYRGCGVFIVAGAGVKNTELRDVFEATK